MLHPPPQAVSPHGATLVTAVWAHCARCGPFPQGPTWTSLTATQHAAGLVPKPPTSIPTPQTVPLPQLGPLRRLSEGRSNFAQLGSGPTKNLPALLSRPSVSQAPGSELPVLAQEPLSASRLPFSLANPENLA